METTHKDDIKLSELMAEFLEYHEALNHSPMTVRRCSDITAVLFRFMGSDNPAAGQRGAARTYGGMPLDRTAERSGRV